MNNSNANLSNSHEATAMKVNKSRKSSKLRNHNRLITERVRRGLRNGPPRGRNWQENAPKSGRHAHLYKYYTRKILKSNLNAEAARLKRENATLKQAEKFFKSLKTPAKAKSRKILLLKNKPNELNDLANMFSGIKVKSPPKVKSEPSVENLEKMFGLMKH